MATVIPCGVCQVEVLVEEPWTSRVIHHRCVSCGTVIHWLATEGPLLPARCLACVLAAEPEGVP